MTTTTTKNSAECPYTLELLVSIASSVVEYCKERGIGDDSKALVMMEEFLDAYLKDCPVKNSKLSARSIPVLTQRKVELATKDEIGDVFETWYHKMYSKLTKRSVWFLLVNLRRNGVADCENRGARSHRGFAKKGK